MSDGLIMSLGVSVKDFVLWIANFLVSEEGAPGLVAALLVVLALIVVIWAGRSYRRRKGAINRFRRKLNELGGDSLLQGRDVITAWFKDQKPNSENQILAKAWYKYDETLFIDDSKGELRLRSSLRPSVFFNIDDLHFGSGFFRIVPGLFISTGLALTFLGLIAALADMSKEGVIDATTMSNLITIASAKFIMSLTGLVCSIGLTIALRMFAGKVDHELHQLCLDLERGTQFSSLEQIGLEQLRTMVEDQEHHRQLTLQMIAEIGGPLKTELPEAISSSIATAIQPILEITTQRGTESLSSMTSELSQQVTAGVGDALATASDRLAMAGDRIGQLADRMDQSSGRMGSEMEGVVTRVAQAVDDLRGVMSATAQTTSGAFAQGAENLLAVMNTTLEGIRDNTGEGARAIAEAASEMRKAAGDLRQEMESAARSGADAAKAHIKAAGGEAGEAIGVAGRSMLEAFGKSSADIVVMTQALSDKTSENVIAPISAISDKLGEINNVLSGSSVEMRRLVDSIRDGALAGSEAAISFRGASQELVNAATPVRGVAERIESSIRQLNDGTRNAVETVTKSSLTTAEAAAHTLDAARETLAAERKGIDATLAGVAVMLDRMNGQGDKMDTIDEKLGRAFDIYTNQTEQAMQSIRSHVQTMAGELNVALSTLQTILDGFQEFQPQQGRR